MIWIVLAAALFAGLGAVLLTRSRSAAAARSSARRQRSREVPHPARATPARAANDSHSDKPAIAAHSPYAAVSIRPGAELCENAASQLNVRFLETAAPRLPLPSCDLAHCECTFEHHQDRRRNREGERRFGVGLKSELYGTAGEPERRQRRGRRETDRF